MAHSRFHIAASQPFHDDLDFAWHSRGAGFDTTAIAGAWVIADGFCGSLVATRHCCPFGNNHHLWQQRLLGGIFPLYGLVGIVLAHVFFNLPLAARLLADGLDNVSPESHRLAAQLNFNDWQVWQHVDWPVLRTLLPRLSALIFLLCAASFVIVLTLGGPSATTLEVAIYHALRLDFDVSRALTLSMLQVALSILLVWGAGRLAYASPLLPSLGTTAWRQDGKRRSTMLLDFTALGLAALVVLPPPGATRFCGWAIC